jgi:HSP20 family protein
MLFETSLTAAPVFGLRREMNRLFDDMLTRTTPSNAWAPPVDVREDDREIALSVELPGVKPEDVEVTCDNGLLSIHGQKNAERKEDEGEYHLVERSYGTFTRSFRLPKGVDDSKITADFEHGVLHVHVPKAALPQPKKIQIGTRGAGDGQQQRVEGAGTANRASSAQTPSSTGAAAGHAADRGTGTNAVA